MPSREVAGAHNLAAHPEAGGMIRGTLGDRGGGLISSVNINGASERSHSAVNGENGDK